MLALTSITGKLGGATLNAILERNLIPPSQLVICTSSDPSSPKLSAYKSQGIQIRSFNFEHPNPAAFEGCTKLFLVSTPAIQLDFNDAPPGQGREKHHIAAISAAKSAGVKHIIYTSLAFGSFSGAGVMRAHLRTEAYLRELEREGEMKVTVLREGLYNSSWPLYLGYFDVGKDERDEIVIAGDGTISWTSIEDLGLTTALVIADETGRREGKKFYLASKRNRKTLKEIASIVGSVRRREITVNIVSREEYVEYYVGRGRDRAAVEWWSSTYEALENGECLIEDPTLDKMLERLGVEAKSVEETIKEMLSA
ncbi:NAD(P)-binding protein [Stipitochalara longipes BDJ]|nr:NAD(P)-binding protein [Stipitochalara longipes BDJ]